MSGYVIAVETSVSPRGEIGSRTVWTPVCGLAGKPSGTEMRQIRQAFPGKSVHQFTDEAWEGLSPGDRDTDWVCLGDHHVPRCGQEI